MNRGDVVRFETKLYLITHVSPSRLQLRSWDGGCIDLEQRRELELKRVSRTGQWPFLIVPPHRGTGLIEVTRDVGGTQQRLEPLLDWAPLNLDLTGGAVFFRPGLGLKPGSVLIGKQRHGALLRIAVPKGFGSVTARVKRAVTASEKIPAFDHMFDEDT